MPFVLDSGLEKKTLPTKADVERAIGKLPALSYYAVAEVDDAGQVVSTYVEEFVVL
jgi:hypothetical protein